MSSQACQMLLKRVLVQLKHEYYLFRSFSNDRNTTLRRVASM